MLKTKIQYSWSYFLFAALISQEVCGFEKENDYFSMDLTELMDVSISSATKHPQEAKTIPASITIIPRSEIKQYGYTTLVELFKNIPGFYLNNNTEDQRIGVRGVIGGGIQFLVNGVPQHPSLVKGLTMPEISRFNIPIESIDSIEVVRGPMSVIYGNNAFKGSINIITNDVENQGSLIAVGYGSQDTSKIFGRFAQQLDEGFVSLNMELFKTDGLGGKYKDMMSPEQLEQLDPAMHKSLQGDVKHDNFSLDFSTAWQDFSANLRYSDMDYGFYAFTPSFGSGNQLNLKTLNTMLGYKTDLSNTLKFSSNFVYSHEKYDLPQLDFLYQDAQNQPLSQFQETSRAEVELNLLYEPNENVSFLTGYRYRQIYNTQNVADMSPIGVDFKDNTDNIKQNDLFFQASYQLFDSLNLVAGNRWTQTRNYKFVDNNYASDSVNITDLHDDEEIYSTPNLAAIYSINNNHILKLLYGEALQDHSSFHFTDPEEIKTYEINYLAMYEKVYFSWSIFYNNSKHLLRTNQRYDSDTGVYENYKDNSGKIESTGTEFIFKYQPINHLDIELSTTWQETDDKKNTHIDVGESPEWLAKAKVSYQHNNLIYSLFGHYVSSMKADYVFVDSSNIGQYERLGEKVDSSFSLGANIRYNHPDSGFYANLHIENILDEDIYTPANELINMEQGLLSQERQVMLTLGMEF